MAWGKRGEKKRLLGKVCGYRKYDKVKYLGEEYFIMGHSNKTRATLMKIDGKQVSFSHMPRGWKTCMKENFTRISSGKRGMLCEIKKVG
jgi:hypothetical protein